MIKKIFLLSIAFFLLLGCDKSAILSNSGASEKNDLNALFYKQISEGLSVSPETVKWHIGNMLRKTGFDSKTKLAVAVTKKNLIINGF